ncbi:hypothetical protein E6H11_09255 [Candidatus Bathyarchaeota archaeon]|nr:MAG: hypothetical protein E6H11_09255 [Candidatus Bathyarchaeota archaeon]
MTAPARPSIVRRKNPAQVGHTLNSPTIAPSPPNHLPRTLGDSFVYEYVAIDTFRPTSHDTAMRRITFTGTIKIANC